MSIYIELLLNQWVLLIGSSLGSHLCIWPMWGTKVQDRRKDAAGAGRTN